MEHQHHRSVADLLLDDSFCQWLKGQGTEADNIYWEHWLTAQPHHAGWADEARKLYTALKTPPAALSEAELEAETVRLLHKTVPDAPIARPQSVPLWWAVAASVALLIGVVGGWWLGHKTPASNPAMAATNTATIAHQAVNDTLVHFSDGSVGYFKRGSSFRYAHPFSGVQREVVLTVGEAFFEVAKNKDKPFVVFTHDLVAKVLGTSFSVRTALGSDGTSSVVVRSGKVAVFRKHDFVASTTAVKDSVLLLPNQQVKQILEAAPLVATLAETPVLIEAPAENPDFAFDNVPVGDIFRTLAQAYGVDIVAEPQLAQHCRMSISLGSQDTLFDKLKVVCKVIGAHYECIDTRIVISGKGCSQ